MKRVRTSERTPPREQPPTKRFSKSEVQSMIREEVQSAVKQKETKMENLLERAQQMEWEGKYDLALRRLEAHANKIKRRGQAAMAHLRKMETKGTSTENVTLTSFSISSNVDLCSSDSEEMLSDTMSHHQQDSADQGVLVKTEVHTPPSALRPPLLQSPPPPQLQADHDNFDPTLRADKTELSLVDMKKSPVDRKQPPVDRKEPQASRLPSQGEYSIPPLPTKPFPSVLNAEAASYCIPQKPQLLLAYIRNPPSVSVLWTVDEVDPSAPPMESYGVFMAVESSRGSGLFPEWTPLGEVKAIPLPMCVVISKYLPGHRMCFSVVGRDTFGRYGPYSEVVHASAPYSEVVHVSAPYSEVVHASALYSEVVHASAPYSEVVHASAPE